MKVERTQKEYSKHNIRKLDNMQRTEDKINKKSNLSPNTRSPLLPENDTVGVFTGRNSNFESKPRNSKPLDIFSPLQL